MFLIVFLLNFLAFSIFSCNLPGYGFLLKEDYQKLSELFLNGYNINQKGHNGYTYLHIAAQRSSSIMVRFLVENGADIEALDFWQRRPVDAAAEGLNWLSLQYLLTLKPKTLFDKRIRFISDVPEIDLWNALPEWVKEKDYFIGLEMPKHIIEEIVLPFWLKDSSWDEFLKTLTGESKALL